MAWFLEKKTKHSYIIFFRGLQKASNFSRTFSIFNESPAWSHENVLYTSTASSPMTVSKVATLVAVAIQFGQSRDFVYHVLDYLNMAKDVSWWSKIDHQKIPAVYHVSDYLYMVNDFSSWSKWDNHEKSFTMYSVYSRVECCVVYTGFMKSRKIVYRTYRINHKIGRYVCHR